MKIENEQNLINSCVQMERQRGNHDCQVIILITTESCERLQ